MIDELKLTNFRSHRDRQWQFTPLTFVVGRNGIGKTNILEALWTLATTRSFRTRRDREVITWGETTARIVAHQFSWALTTEPSLIKQVAINGRQERPIDYLGSLRAVLFTPDSLAIVAGSPDERRRFLDTLLAQSNRVYAHKLAAYRHAILERNHLLKQIARGEQPIDLLDTWDVYVAQTGQVLVEARQTLIMTITARVADFYTAIAEDRQGQLMLNYQATISGSIDTWLEAFRQLRDRELHLGATLIGPHRDELLITLDNHAVALYASRGQMRTIIIALKWVELQIFHEHDHPTLLLLDDVFSELDRAHQEALADLLQLTQTVCTMTSLTDIPSSLQKLEAGTILLDHTERDIYL